MIAAQLSVTSPGTARGPFYPRGDFHATGAPNPMKRAAPPISIMHGPIAAPLRQASAYLVCVRLRRELGPSLAADGGRRSARRDGDIRIIDLAAPCERDLDTAPEWAQFHLPRQTLDRLASEHDWPLAAGLDDCSTGFDPVLLGLSKLVLPWLHDSAPPDEVFLEHVSLSCAPISSSNTPDPTAFRAALSVAWRRGNGGECSSSWPRTSPAESLWQRSPKPAGSR